MNNIILIDNCYDKTILFLDKIINIDDINYSIYLHFVDEIKKYYIKNDMEECIKECIKELDSNNKNIYFNNIKSNIQKMLEIKKNNKKISLLFYFFTLSFILQLNISVDILNYDKKDFFKDYPQYEYLENDEISSLIIFRNTLKCAFLIMNPKKNKDRLFSILPFLIKENKKYILGSGQKKSTRRVEIYNFEGNVIPNKRKRIFTNDISLKNGDNIEEDTKPIKRKKICTNDLSLKNGDNIEENTKPNKTKRIRSKNNKKINYDYLDYFDLNSFYTDNFYLNNIKLDHIKLDHNNLDFLNNLDLSKIYLDFTSIPDSNV